MTLNVNDENLYIKSRMAQLPEPEVGEKHKVGRGESLWTLAEKAVGKNAKRQVKSDYMLMIAKLNHLDTQEKMNRLNEGQEISLPKDFQAKTSKAKNLESGVPLKKPVEKVSIKPTFFSMLKPENKPFFISMEGVAKKPETQQAAAKPKTSNKPVIKTTQVVKSKDVKPAQKAPVPAVPAVQKQDNRPEKVKLAEKNLAYVHERLKNAELDLQPSTNNGNNSENSYFVMASRKDDPEKKRLIAYIKVSDSGDKVSEINLYGKKPSEYNNDVEDFVKYDVKGNALLEDKRLYMSSQEVVLNGDPKKIEFIKRKLLETVKQYEAEHANKTQKTVQQPDINPRDAQYAQKAFVDFDKKLFNSELQVSESSVITFQHVDNKNKLYQIYSKDDNASLHRRLLSITQTSDGKISDITIYLSVPKGEKSLVTEHLVYEIKGNELRWVDNYGRKRDVVLKIKPEKMQAINEQLLKVIATCKD